jgi:hypothetical protein
MFASEHQHAIDGAGGGTFSGHHATYRGNDQLRCFDRNRTKIRERTQLRGGNRAFGASDLRIKFDFQGVSRLLCLGRDPPLRVLEKGFGLLTTVSTGALVLAYALL